ncbi:MAG: hypothetical protein CFE26_02535 [Verrucomicrobiales bacterium VVV1]|nr:MAG: hypothetical protein CFE26_02535 [Verrucomicrobiales bacterium VVV1]
MLVVSWSNSTGEARRNWKIWIGFHNVSEIVVCAVILLIRMRIARHRKSLLVVAALLVMTAGVLAYLKLTKPKPWSHDRMAEGAIHSVSTGMIRGGKEIVVAAGFVRGSGNELIRVVCCYDALSGAVLWEKRKDGYLNQDAPQVNVSMDGNGDILVSSFRRVPSQHSVVTLAKLCGPDGSRIWEKEFSVVDSSYQIPFTPPAIDVSGNVWVIALEQKLNVRISSLILLSGGDGTLISTSELSESSSDTSAAEVVCLKRGGTLVFITRQVSGEFVYRFSSAGELLESYPLDFSTGGTGTLDIRRYVDEERQRFIISEESWEDGYSTWGTSNVHTAAFSIAGGKKQWESSIPLSGKWGHSEGYLPELCHLRPDGDLECRYEVYVTDSKFDWQHWKKVKGIPLPARISEVRKCLEKTLVSGKDGSKGMAKAVSSRDNWFELQELEAGTSTKEAHRYGHKVFGSGRYRCRDSRRWLLVAASGPAGVGRQSFRVVQTPSGRIILSRDPTDRNYLPGFKNWQIMAP